MPRTFASGTYQTHAIVLRVRPLGENDRVLTILCEERGKMDAVVKGARRPKSKMAAAAQPYVLARFLVAHGRSLDLVTQAEIESAHQNIAGDLLKAAWAAYCCELTSYLPEHLPEHGLFPLLCSTLQALDAAGDDGIDTVGFRFEARYLSLLGYTPRIGQCVGCDLKISIASGDQISRIPYSPSLGGTLCESCRSRDPHHLKPAVRTLRLLHRMALGSAVAELSFDAATKRELCDCLRATLACHLERRPKSLNFLNEVAGATAQQGRN